MNQIKIHLVDGSNYNHHFSKELTKEDVDKFIKDLDFGKTVVIEKDENYHIYSINNITKVAIS